jgi:hypothetical protein
MGDLRLSILVGILFVIEFVLAPLEGSGTLNQQGINLLMGLLLGFGALLVTSRRNVQFAILIILVGSAFTNLHAGPAVTAFRVTEGVLHFAILGILIAEVAGAVFAPGRINTHRILGSIAIYFIVGLIFANAYSLLRDFNPKAFTFQTTWNALYFSFSTMTTAGYGDIVPVGPVARSLTNLQAVFGQLYPATIIARLITLEIGQRQ